MAWAKFADPWLPDYAGLGAIIGNSRTVPISTLNRGR
jgi:hypothetical protein